MEIKRTGSGLCDQYYVKSESDGLAYAVHLLDNGGRGSCTCRDYECRRKLSVNLEVDTSQPRQLFQCKHIRECAMDYYFVITEALAKQQQ